MAGNHVIKVGVMPVQVRVVILYRRRRDFVVQPRERPKLVVLCIIFLMRDFLDLCKFVQGGLHCFLKTLCYSLHYIDHFTSRWGGHSHIWCLSCPRGRWRYLYSSPLQGRARGADPTLHGSGVLGRGLP